MEFMEEAYKEAIKSYELNEIPIGCVITKKNKIIGRGHNTLKISNTAISHAEINAIHQATENEGTWNLEDCTMYITLEPCMMCTGAIFLSRIKKIVIGSLNDKGGFALSNFNIKEGKGINHRPNISVEIHDKSIELLKKYFKEKRIMRPEVRKVESDKQLEQCLEIRKKVFVDEQKVSIEEEIDQYDTIDGTTIHLLAKVNNEEVGTLRIINKGNDIYKIGRVAVLKEYRQFKVGFSMMQYAENTIRNMKGKEIQLEAQLQAMNFYRKSGFIEEGEVFLDANIEHKLMRKKIRENQ